jgi:hypothetical protein
MRSNFILGVAAIAAVFGAGGVAAAQMDLSLNASALLANNAASLRPPAGVGLNQKGLAAIKPVGAQPGVSAATSSDMLSSLARVDTDNMLRSPDSTQNQLINNLLSGSREVTNDDLLRPPPK